MPKPKLPSEKSRSKEFGRILRRAREKKGISLRAAARMMLISPALLSKAERGFVDFRKPAYVSRAAGVLDADVNELREAAGLESLDWEEVWLRVSSLGGDLIGLRLKDKRDEHLFKVLGYILLMVSFVAAEAREPGGPFREKREKELEEILKLILLVAERRHNGNWAGWTKRRDDSVQALHESVDAVLDALYRVHADDVERLLKAK